MLVQYKMTKPIYQATQATEPVQVCVDVDNIATISNRAISYQKLKRRAQNGITQQTKPNEDKLLNNCSMGN
eukprot:scaffold527935_cov19-Prasinocladus_malaysianus.AAC.1